ncbi:hypothetical protein H4Q26_017120 [Puccinia striiformis f. sp. tritici PST-130]|nr:hypothetical protein H4Q26_017120 [Puccinia striiformis f. sp. tritici PST-130]
MGLRNLRSGKSYRLCRHGHSEDLKVNADYIRMADRYVEVPGGSNNNNYANVDVMLMSLNVRVFMPFGPDGDMHLRTPDFRTLFRFCTPMAWSGSSLFETETSAQGYLTVADDVYKKACVTDVEVGLRMAEEIGYPVMIKASEGGGGKGIRKVEKAENFTMSFNAVLGEVPGSPVFIMKLAGAARHLEVQVLADQYGNAISLFGRDCSVQHGEGRRQTRQTSRLRLGRDNRVPLRSFHDKFYFLELNPRLQVEHPTTEMVSGVNLPAAQLQIAMGIPLHQIRDIRTLYGKNPHGNSQIDFDFNLPQSSDTQRKPMPKGHVVAVRITAENPDAGFKPSSGTLQELNFRSSTNVWGYFSVGTAGGLHEFADSQFGHIFAYGADRSESRKAMIVALKELSIRGDFRTTVEYLINLRIKHNPTAWLDTLISANMTAERPDNTLAVICGAVTKAHLQAVAASDEYKRILDKGQVPDRNLLRTAFTLDFIYENIKYQVLAARSAAGLYSLFCNGGKVSVGLRTLADGGLLVLLDGRSHTVYWREEVGALRLMVNSKTCLIEQESDPTQLRSPSPGKLVRFLVESGDHIKAGEAYAEIEVMKMYMPLVASEDGIPQTITCDGTAEHRWLEASSTIRQSSQNPLRHSRRLRQRLGHAKYTEDLMVVLQDPELPYGRATAILSTLSGRMPAKLEASIRSTSSNRPEHFDPLEDVINRFKGGLKSHGYLTLSELMAAYYAVENIFNSNQEDDIILQLRDQNRESLDEVVRLVLSHSKCGSKNQLILAVLDIVSKTASQAAVETTFHDSLSQLAQLESKAASKVALKAKEVLIHCQLPSLDERLGQMESILKTSLQPTVYGEANRGQPQPSYEVLRELVDSKYTVFDVLPTFYDHPDPWVALAALEVYVRRAYRSYSIVNFEYEEGDVNENEPVMVSWLFRIRKGASPPSTPRKGMTGRLASFSDLTYVVNQLQDEPMRSGVMFSIKSLEDLDKFMPNVLLKFPEVQPKLLNPDPEGEPHHNVLNIAYRLDDLKADQTDAEWHVKFQNVCEKFDQSLTRRGVTRVTFKICRKEQYPSYFTLRKHSESKKWEEVVAIRDVEPALAFQLELSRLSNFHVTPCPTENRQIHIYYAEGKENSADSRFFVRTIVRPGRIKGSIKVADYLVAEAERLLNDALNALELVSATRRGVDVNHLTLNFVYGIPIGFEELQTALAGFLERHGKRLWRLRVTAAEVRLVIEDESGSPQAIRVMIDNLSGFVVKFEAYKEVTTEKGKTILKSIGPVGAYHLQPVNFPYPTKEWLQPKRFKAHVVGTTYCYDFPDLFRQAARREWKRRSGEIPFLKPPTDPLVATELVQDEYGTPQEVSRPPGRNTVGMVAWIRMIVIANDITFKIGSFGPAEDDFFYRVTELARKLGVPRIYLSANSGARLGIADEVTDLFCAAWNEPENPSKGFKFLYLTQDSVKRLKDKGEENVVTEEVEYEGQTVHQIKAVIGSQDGLGVESLRGSGLIAGGTSRAYNDIFTITLVTARSVGIGAYLVRLGQRAVQVEGQPIILTGASALNKVLGREVYSSNLQLGGTQIMHRNGVSHLTASNDLEGVSHIMDWMSYIPECRGGPLPIMSAKDSWDRTIDYLPIKGAYDPRWFLAGKEEVTEDSGAGESRFLSGFFDRGSFQETLSGWAQTVVVGRARLGGIPMGCIAVETRTIEKAGQVWYPNSSHKTAQAIEDFNREELPLIIFANWRGFSGGQQDMFDEVLKRGSMIVDGLSSYKQPVFVYIIPNGELRGGAWVVLDPSINPNGMMEMYADKTSRAGVLEPEGIVEIKFRKAKILEMMDRLDPQYAELKAATSDMSKTSEELSTLKTELAAREKQLSGTYTAMALQFADLHDRTERMKAKGTIREALDWSESRRYFYWRLRRRLLEEEILREIGESRTIITSGYRPSIQANRKDEDHRGRFLHDLSLEEIQTNDQVVCSKIEERTKLIDALVSETERASLESQIQGLINSKSDLVFESIKKVLGDRLSPEEISVCLSSPIVPPLNHDSALQYCKLITRPNYLPSLPDQFQVLSKLGKNH